MPSLRARSLMELVTVTRATTATYCGSDGLLASAAAGVARIDHDPVTRAVRGLLVEEARTNLLLRSQEIDNAAWSKVRSSSTANTALAPDGTTTADSIIEDATASSTHYVRQDATVASTTNLAYTFSVFVKAGTRSFARIELVEGAASSECYVSVNLTNGALGTPGIIGSNWDSALTYSEDWGNGWWRVTIVGRKVSASTVVGGLVILESALGTSSYTGDGVSLIYAWGGQLELGAFSTSYVPTTTATVTRNADDIRMASLSPWLDEEAAGTLVAEYSVPWTYSALNTTDRRIVEIDDGSGTNRHMLYVAGGGVGSDTVAGGVVQAAAIIRAQAARNVIQRAAWTWAADNFAQAVDGSLVATDQAGTVPATLSEAHLGASAGAGGSLCGHLRRLRFYPRRVSNTELQQLTKAA